MASTSLIACPACAAAIARIVIDLDGDRPPALPRCSACDTPHMALGWRTTPAAFVLSAPAKAVCDWRSLERITERAFWRALAVAPDVVKQAPDDCLRRVVFGGAAAAEKLTIWQAGLQDATIECLKLDLRLRLPRLRAHPDADLRLMRVDDALHFATTHGPGLRVPLRRLHQFQAEESALAHRWPALFAGPFVDHLRLRD